MVFGSFTHLEQVTSVLWYSQPDVAEVRTRPVWLCQSCPAGVINKNMGYYPFTEEIRAVGFLPIQNMNKMLKHQTNWKFWPAVRGSSCWFSPACKQNHRCGAKKKTQLVRGISSFGETEDILPLHAGW